MQLEKLDSEYLEIVKNILNNKEYKELRKCEHHGINRYEHSLKVSYMAYKYAKKHNLDYKEAAIGGLLHDFFITGNMNFIEKTKSFFNHPKKSLSNSLKFYSITAKEENIIISHMFPFGSKIPKYKESWVVSLCDKKVAFTEFRLKFNYKFRYASNLTLLILLNFIK